MSTRAILLAVAGILAVLVIGWLDAVTGPNIGMSLFYLLPVVFSGWYGGRWVATAIAVVGATMWVVAELHGHPTTALAVTSWNGLTRLLINSFVGLVIVAARRDRARLSELLDTAERLARTDPLTGLYNSRAFYELVSHELPRLRRTEAGLTIAYLDLDDFKAVNDQFGHATGDELLARVATVLRENVRAGDVVARLGGDEFAIVLFEADAKNAEGVCARIVEAVVRLRDAYPDTHLGMSAGVAYFATAPDDVDEVVANADRAMYDAKRSGKGKVVVRAGQPMIHWSNRPRRSPAADPR